MRNARKTASRMRRWSKNYVRNMKIKEADNMTSLAKCKFWLCFLQEKRE
jgi:hypothetical protein